MTGEPLYIAALIVIYAIPSIVALARRHRHMVKICLVNLFLGWTIYGWIVALTWSATTLEKSAENETGFRSRFVSFFRPFR